MNTARLNFTRLNTSVLNASLLNSSLMGGRGKGSSSRPNGLIAQYKPYLNSNDSPTRDVLKDYSWHGNDVVLHNFAFSGMSGYGGYLRILDTYQKKYTTIDASKNVAIINGKKGGSADVVLSGNSTGVVRLRVSGLNAAMEQVPDIINMRASYSGGTIQEFSSDGIAEFELPGEIAYFTIIMSNAEQEHLFPSPIIVEQLPVYPGALVSDGVDDYGICENFPILTKEKGYTVCALRKWLDKEKDQVLLCKLNDDNHGAFLFECIEANSHRIYSYGAITFINSFPDLFSFQKKNKYNTYSIGVGNNQDGSTLSLFRGRYGYYYYSNIALYALEIYDRDLTEEEIETVKQRMMAEYEKATGNVLEGVILLEDGTDLLLEDGTSLLME